MVQGQLVNAQVGRQLYPQGTAAAGGMTYRPSLRDASEADVAHNHGREGSTPSPATICAMLTKQGMECEARPTETGFCIGHSRAVAKVVGGLLGG